VGRALLEFGISLLLFGAVPGGRVFNLNTSNFFAMKKTYWVDIISSLFILLFIYTAFNKFMGFERFRSVLHGSPLIKSQSDLVAWLIPSVEIIISALLFFPRSRRIGLLASLILMIIFTSYITYMLIFSNHIPCSCGGVIEKMTWNQHLIFNICFILLAGFALWLNKVGNKSPKVDLQYSASA
jgi:hypothetical protein